MAMPVKLTESPSASIPCSGIGIVTFSPATARACTSCGWGAVSFSGSEPTTVRFTLALATFPEASRTGERSLPEPGWLAARKRTTLSETKALPRLADTELCRSGCTVSLSPPGERSLFSTEILPTSPTRTTRLSSFSSGGLVMSVAGVGTTLIVPWVAPDWLTAV